jgi:hypothetical protein
LNVLLISSFYFYRALRWPSFRERQPFSRARWLAWWFAWLRRWLQASWELLWGRPLVPPNACWKQAQCQKKPVVFQFYTHLAFVS